MHGGATIQDVIVFMHGFGYRAFYADGVGELTQLADRAAFQPDAADAAVASKVCPNYLFLRSDLDIADYTNPLGCGERR